MDGYDCAHPFQKDINTKDVPADFVIVKVGQGCHYVNPQWRQMIDGALSSGKLGGLYYYGEGKDAKAEAEHFVGLIRPYIGRVILAYDWEGMQNGAFNKTGEVKYVRKIMEQVHAMTGVYPFLYCSQSVTLRRDWSSVAQHCPLWMAQYKSNSPQIGYTTPTGYGKSGAWKAPAIWQYSSRGRLAGYAGNPHNPDGNIDLDIAYITADEWRAYATPDNATVQDDTVELRGLLMPVLRKGMQGDAVRVWQGIVGAEEDGDFGPQTLAATLAYQRTHKGCGNPDGIVARKSWTTGLEGLE